MNVDNANLARALRGPVVLITIGTLFLLDRFTPFGFSETWPVILIVLGVLALAGGSRRDRGTPGYPSAGQPVGAAPMSANPPVPPPSGAYSATNYSASKYPTDPSTGGQR